MLEADHARMQRELKEVQIKAAAEIKEVRKQASAESDHLTSHNRLIARQREDDLAMLKVRRLRCARCPRLGAHGHARASPCLFVFARVGCGRDFVTQEQYAEVQAMYAARVKALEEKLSALRQKCVCSAFAVLAGTSLRLQHLTLRVCMVGWVPCATGTRPWKSAATWSWRASPSTLPTCGVR